MRIFHGIENANIAKPTVLTLGVFDGLHLGHQQIMRTVVERAEAVGAAATAITFDPHPRAVLHPESAPPLLQTLDQRLANLDVLGIEQTIVIKFDRDFSSQPAEDFLRNIIRDRLHAKEVYLGKGFAFGKERGGNIELLRSMSAELGFRADEVDEVRLRGVRISSSAIRELLIAGRINLARRMLGRPYGVEGVIIRGDRRGHTIGFPTANLVLRRKPPLAGIFAVEAELEETRQAWRGVASIGRRPTVAANGPMLLEVHLFDLERELYGRHLSVRFLEKLREEKKFDGMQALAAAIRQDAEQARQYFRAHG